MSGTVQIEIRRVTRTDEADVAAMERLYRAYYEGAAETDFIRDLEAKDAAIVLREGETVCGFSTFRVFAAEGMTVLFSGDTVVDERCRGQVGLAGAFGHVMQRLNREHDPDSLHWFLICKGARTYRFLPTFFNRYVPGPTEDRELSDRLRRLASALYPDAYDPAAGVLRFGAGKDRLKADLLRGDAESVRFRALDPGWSAGEELCCLAPLRMDNLNARGRRVIEGTDSVWRW